MEERLDTIYTLARKHRVHPTELPHLQQQLMEELEGLNASDESIERLGEELAAFAQHYKEKALELSALRQQAAQQLAVAVEQEIQRLGMPGGRFCIALTPNEEQTFRLMAWSRSSYWSAPTLANRSRAWPRWLQVANCPASAWRSR